MAHSHQCIIIVMCFNLGSVHYLYRETVSVLDGYPVHTDFALTLLYTCNSVLVCITAELLIPTCEHLVLISRFLDVEASFPGPVIFMQIEGGEESGNG